MAGPGLQVPECEVGERSCSSCSVIFSFHLFLIVFNELIHRFQMPKIFNVILSICAILASTSEHNPCVRGEATVYVIESGAIKSLQQCPINSAGDSGHQWMNFNGAFSGACLCNVQ